MKKLIIIALALVSTAAFADDGSFFNAYTKNAFYFLAVAITAFGGTAAQSRAASVALEGIARNPSASDKLMTPMILGLALMESLVIFTWATIFVAK